MKSGIMLSFMALLFAHVSYAANVPQKQDLILYVEKGDSYISLFGDDWQKVYNTNNTIRFCDKKGRVIQTPDKLVIGTKLHIPPHTHLRQRAVKRLGKYKKIQDSAFNSIKKAETFFHQSMNKTSLTYKQGNQFLCKAREAINGKAFGFRNYVEADRLAQEAIHSFKIARDLDKAQIIKINAVSTSKNMRSEHIKHITFLFCIVFILYDVKVNILKRMP